MLIKVAAEDLSEAAIVFLRTLLGAAVVAPLALRAGTLPALRGHVRWLLVVAAVQMAAPFVLITFGERWVSSSLTGILVASAPVFTALLALRLEPEGRSGAALAGIAFGMTGIVLLFGLDLSGDAGALLGGGMLLLASLGYAVGAFIFRRKLAGVPATAAAASSMTLTAIATAPAVVLTLPDRMPEADTVGALLVLGIGGTGLAFVVFYALLSDVGPTRASIAGYLAPAFALVYGASILGERLTVASVAGLALILGGSWLVAERRLPRWVRRVPEPEAAPAVAALPDRVPSGR
jgi:drug/metabolite transporter (DMT)-like permease